MNDGIAQSARKLKLTCLFFVPAWLHALFVPSISISVLNLDEPFGSIMWFLCFVLWLPPLVPVLRRAITFNRAALLTAVPYVPYVIYQIATMPD